MKVYTAPRGFKLLWNRVFYGRFANWPKTIWYHLFIAESAYRRVKKRAEQLPARPLKVIFFVLDISMWKYESLMRLLLDDPRFDPVIIPYPILWHSKEELKRSEKGIIEYCQKKDFPYVIGYNIDTMEYIQAKELNADFVSYSQPYNNCPDFWKVEQFYRNALIFSYPYGLPIDNNKHFNNLLSQNVSWRLFYHNKSSFSVFERNPITHGKNFRWVGNVFYDKIKSHKSGSSLWKSDAQEFKRIIWAPHHTIGENDDLPFSNFLELHDKFIEIARMYQNRVQFAFKPHPMLYHRLIDLWGKEKTDSYYQIWSDMPNTCYVSGDYTDIFISSDAMIHDCAGFTFEYLFTNNPVMFVNMRNNNMQEYMPGFSFQCYSQHYVAEKYGDIAEFIDKVVIEGNDVMAEKRSVFFNNELVPPGKHNVGENMMDEFLTVLR